MRVGGTHGVPSPWCSSARAARPSPSAVPRPRSILCTWGRGPRDSGQERVQLRPCPWCACPPCEHNIRSNALPASLPSAPTFLCCCRQLVQWDGRLPQVGHRALKILVALEVLEFILLVLRLRGVSGQPIRDCPPHLLGLAPLPGVVRGPVGTATCSCDQRHATHPGELRCPHSRGVTGSAPSCSCDAVRLYGKWRHLLGPGEGSQPHTVSLAMWQTGPSDLREPAAWGRPAHSLRGPSERGNPEDGLS